LVQKNSNIGWMYQYINCNTDHSESRNCKQYNCCCANNMFWYDTGSINRVNSNRWQWRWNLHILMGEQYNKCCSRFWFCIRNKQCNWIYTGIINTNYLVQENGNIGWMYQYLS